MLQAVETRGEARELDFRTSDGIEVRLLWTPGDTGVVVEVVDRKRNESFRLQVAGEEALDAFNHPYAYAASAGLLPDAGVVAPERTRPI
jgi:hypothetical protein